MNDMQDPTKKRVSKFVKIATFIIVIIIIVPAILIGFVWHANASAERDAQVFCDSIESGTDISLAITKFEKQTGFEKVAGGKVSALHYGFPEPGFSKDSHTFLFPGVMFDKAYCDVSVTEGGKVISKHSYMLYD